MRKNNLQAFKFSILLMSSLMTVNCSTIKNVFDDSGEELPAGAFRSTASIRAQTVPLPVDIAENILSIENGKVTLDEAPKAPTKSTPKEVVAVEPVAPPKPSYHPFSGRRRISSNSIRASQVGKVQNYTVQPGDTLMKIAFAKYGDIFRWRDIYNDNRSLLRDYNKIEIGSLLVLNGVEFVVIEKNGEPYLIRRGDTLGKISNKLYGTRDKWRALWQNNRQLIKNPNRIYAGFTLYYQPASAMKNVEVREPTSGKK